MAAGRIWAWGIRGYTAHRLAYVGRGRPQRAVVVVQVNCDQPGRGVDVGGALGCQGATWDAPWWIGSLSFSQCK